MPSEYSMLSSTTGRTNSYSLTYNDYVSILGAEMVAVEGEAIQNPETSGASSGSSLGSLSNRLFGAPYQLLPSVDYRFSNVNSGVGTEYLRHFLLHSPILYIKPGMPKYTGGENVSSITRAMQNAYGSESAIQSVLLDVAGATVLSGGSKLQKRMFGFRETYSEYMQYVNYMCQSVAKFMGLGDDGKYPSGTFLSGSSSMKAFTDQSFRWENYRMTDAYVNSIFEQYMDVVGATLGGPVGQGALGILSFVNPLSDDFIDPAALYERVSGAWETMRNTDVYGVTSNKVQALQLMVEPVSFTENLRNETQPSFIENAIDSITDLGTEIAWITNSGADAGVIQDLTTFLGSGAENVAQNLGGLVERVGGGFMTNLFNGAIQSIKGQKMIYPNIYKRSNSSMDYEFTMTLTSPYGDKYNYYMNIVVPLCHLICLVAPRMVTSNTTSSPFLVQAYIPGMCTCQLGIVSSMTIRKNPKINHVSVDGFPLSVEVNFQIEELYDALAISPIDDPASFAFNETLNDYLANLAGLCPSMDTYYKQRENIYESIEGYFQEGVFVDDIVAPLLESYEDLFFSNAY